jgi:hypothetical protein
VQHKLNRTWTILVIVLALLVSPLPFTLVHASDETSAGDGVVVKIVPRNAVAQGQSALMAPAANEYTFDVSLFDATGAPKTVTSWGYVLESLDSSFGGSTGHCAGSGSTMCLWADGGSSSTPVSSFSFSVPAGAINFMGDLPGNGVNVYVTLCELASGGGACPTGHFSLAANSLIDQGSFAQADQADQAGTPLMLLDGQPEGLIQPGNPLVDAGFELGYSDGSESVAQAGGSYPPGVKVAFPGWYLRDYLADAPPGITPASAHHYSTSNGTSGGYMSLVYDAADDGQHLALVQEIGAPNGMTWTGNSVGSPIQVCFDARAGFSSAGSVTFTANVFKAAGGSSVQAANQAVATLPTDWAWRHYCLAYDNADLGGQAIREFFFNFYYAMPEGQRLQIDNVALSGFDLVPGVSAKNDLDDGYSLFIQPYALAATEQNGLVQGLTQLAAGKTAYVYDLSAADYTGGSARSVPLAGVQTLFEVLDATDASTPRSGGANGFATQTAFTLAGSDHVLVVAPADQVTTRAPAVSAWGYANLGPGYVPTDSMVNAVSGPVSGYYSPARNAMAPFSLADAMDYQVTPFALSGKASGLSLASPATVALTCPAASAGSTCAASTNNNPTLLATYASASRVVEPVALRLVSSANPTVSACASNVARCSATVSAQGGSASFTLLKADLDNLKATTGTYGVEVVADHGTFVESATSFALGLDNVVPFAAFSSSPASGIVRTTTVTFSDASHDNDGSVQTRSWSLALPDATTVSFGSVGNNATSVSYKPLQLGAYTMTETIMDNGGETASVSHSFTVQNVAPQAALKAPAFTNAASVVFDASASVDPDAALPANAYAFSTDGATFAPSASALYAVTPAADGPITVWVQVTDADGATSVAQATTDVDTVAPTSTLDLGGYSAGTWSATPIAYSVARSDDNAGILSTIVTVDGKTVTFGKAGPVNGTIGGDGAHTITVASVDLAGNVESATTRTVQVDTSAPDVAFTNPQFAGPIGGAFSAGAQVPMTVAASDDASPVTEVDFLVDGVVVHQDTDPSDGFAYGFDTSGLTPGIYKLQATATNEAGLASSTEIVYVLVGPALPGP